MAKTDRIFRLQHYGDTRNIIGLIMTPEPIAAEKVAAAWGYAVRYTAKGLDLPDHEAALKMFLERHPSWQLIEATVTDVPVNLALADKDVPE